MCFPLPSSLAEDSWLLPNGAGSVRAGRGPAAGTRDLSSRAGGHLPPCISHRHRLAGLGAWVRWVRGGQGAFRVLPSDHPPPHPPGQWVLRLPSSGSHIQWSSGLMQ